MAKPVKQMEMDTLKQTFQGVRDLVLMTASGIDSQTDNQMRLALRKKNIRLQLVKNSLTRRVFDELGLKSTRWDGPTVVAWGGSSIAELSKALEALATKNPKVKDKIQFKGAICDGQEIPFAQALKMPTREEAIGGVVMLALSPARRVAGQIVGPARRLAGQVKSVSEKQEEAPAAAAS